MRKVILLATLVILLFASILYYRIESVRGNLPSFSNFSFLLPSSREEYSEEKNEKDLLVTMSITHTENIKASEKILPSITDEALQNHIGSFMEIQRDELGKINSGLIADYYSGGLILVVSAKSPSLYPNLDGVL